MSRWTTAFASIAIIAFSLPASAADDDLRRNIELKPGAAASDAADKTAEDTGTTTRQIVTEGKDAPAAEAPKEGAASEAAPPAPAPAAPAEAAPPPQRPKPRLRQSRHRHRKRRSLRSKQPFLRRRRRPLPGSSLRKWSSRCRRS